MRNIFLILLVAGMFGGWSCSQVDPDRTGESGAGREASAEEAPLLLEDDPPLLLSDEVPGNGDPSGPMADNSRCHVCHVNYKLEELAVTHARADIGCAGCHGESDAHIADESWSWGGNGTAPDRMFPPKMINPFCMTCHPKEKIADMEQHEPLFAGTGDKKYCTDCHGKHRLPGRKCKWK